MSNQELERQREALRAKVNAPTERELAAAELQRIEQQLVDDREAAGVAAGRERLVGISRAYGSLAELVEQDEERVRQAHEVLCDAIGRLNDRCMKCGQLRAEAQALSDRFGIVAPPFSPVPVPAQRGLNLALPVLLGHHRVRPATEQDETKLRVRRTYTEVAGSLGYTIIDGAGLKPWPSLTPRQQELLAGRAAERHRATAAMRQFAAEAAITRAMPATAPGGGIHRG